MKEWAQKLLVLDSECIVVGLGDGQHVLSLLNEKPLKKVFVVDHRESLRKEFEIRHPELRSQVQIEIFESEASLLSSDFMDQTISRGLSVFSFEPSWAEADRILSSFHQHLTGRSVQSLQKYLAKVGAGDKVVRVMDRPTGRYLSIKDLDLMIEEGSWTQARVNSFRILKELIF